MVLALVVFPILYGLSLYGGDNAVQFSSGTIIAFSVTHDSLAIAADSRLSSSDPRRKPTDDACKIIALSPAAVFFYSGGATEAHATVSNKLLFSASDLARTAFRKTARDDPATRLENTAKLWQGMMQHRVDEIIRTSPSSVWSVERAGSGGFGGLQRDGTPILYLADIGITVATNQSTTATIRLSEVKDMHSGSVGSVGTDEARQSVGEFLANQTDRAKAENKRFQDGVAEKPMLDYAAYRLIAAVQAAVKWAPAANDALVGGNIDAVILPRSGVLRWIQRKKQCYKSDCCRPTK